MKPSAINICHRDTQIAIFMGPTWVLSAPGGPHVGPGSLAIKVYKLGSNTVTEVVCYLFEVRFKAQFKHE